MNGPDFPLGIAFLLLVIFSLSGIFSCCYHWDKLKFLRGAFPDAAVDVEAPPLNHVFPYTDLWKINDESLPVLMPGDEIPRFMALPCPREPPRPEKLDLEMQEPPLKPPRFNFPFCI